MTGRKERRRRWRSRGTAGSGSVNLISMMDILTVLLLYLLKSYVSGGEVMVPPPGIRLPGSTADQPPQSSLVVAIDGDEIMLGNERVASIQEAARLDAARAQQDEIARLRGEAAATTHAATIQGDRDIEFRVLQRVMFTLNQSGFENVALAVIDKT